MHVVLYNVKLYNVKCDAVQRRSRALFYGHVLPRWRSQKSRGDLWGSGMFDILKCDDLLSW